MFEFLPTRLPDCYEIRAKVLKDVRGTFVKTFHAPEFAAQGLKTDFAEEYHSRSSKNVIRGLHFQTPPMEHVKVVYCIEGQVMDVIVDLRVGSPTYGMFEVIELSGDMGNMAYIGVGMAHGFCVRSDHAILAYRVGTIYSPANDKGVRWDSLDIPWPTSQPIISTRDLMHPGFREFESPFVYG